MFNKKYFIIAFVLLACIQLYVPAKMIYEQEDVLNTGNEFKFKAAPIDPNDPFRGKYITLRFDAARFKVQNIKDWVQGEDVFVLVENGETGFAKIAAVLKDKPGNDANFIKANIGYIDEVNSTLIINYPFDRFYMEESKAKPAEDIYRKSILDTTKIAYALVNVKDGEAVVKDVLIDGKSVADLVKAGENK